MIVAVQLVKDHRRSVMWWSIGLLVLIAFTVSLYPSVRGSTEFDALLDELPDALRVLVGAESAISLTSAPGYLHARLFATLLPVLLLSFAISAFANALGGAEQDGTLEPLLANPVSRTRVYVERYAASTALLLLLTAVFTVGLVAFAAPFDALEGVRPSGLAGACAGSFSLALVHGTVAYGAGAATGRRTLAVAVATAVAVGGYLVQTLLSLSDALSDFRVLSPWHAYLDRNMLATGAAPVAVAVPLALAAVAFAAGWRLFLRRDLR